MRGRAFPGCSVRHLPIPSGSLMLAVKSNTSFRCDGSLRSAGCAARGGREHTEIKPKGAAEGTNAAVRPSSPMRSLPGRREGLPPAGPLPPPSPAPRGRAAPLAPPPPARRSRAARAPPRPRRALRLRGAPRTALPLRGRFRCSALARVSPRRGAGGAGARGRPARAGLVREPGRRTAPGRPKTNYTDERRSAPEKVSFYVPLQLGNT